MLILTRKVHQQVVVGQGIQITVLVVRGNQVRIGIEAPPECKVLREELTRVESLPDEKTER